MLSLLLTLAAAAPLLLFAVNRFFFIHRLPGFPHLGKSTQWVLGDFLPPTDTSTRRSSGISTSRRSSSLTSVDRRTRYRCSPRRSSSSATLARWSAVSRSLARSARRRATLKQLSLSPSGKLDLGQEPQSAQHLQSPHAGRALLLRDWRVLPFPHLLPLSLISFPLALISSPLSPIVFLLGQTQPGRRIDDGSLLP